MRFWAGVTVIEAQVAGVRRKRTGTEAGAPADLTWKASVEKLGDGDHYFVFL
jgi:hypothetical protein